jgi:V/A-type H+-transporting ATPase subunit K
MSVLTILNHPAFAAAPEPTTGLFGSNLAAKVIAGSIAFGMAALGAGLAVGRAGAAGLAATAEKTEVRTFALIITSLGEAIAIYGLVVAILIFGQ